MLGFNKNNLQKKYHLDEYVNIIEEMGAGEIILTSANITSISNVSSGE